MKDDHRSRTQLCAVAKRKPEKNSGLYHGIRTLNLCDTGAVAVISAMNFIEEWQLFAFSTKLSLLFTCLDLCSIGSLPSVPETFHARLPVSVPKQTLFSILAMKMSPAGGRLSSFSVRCGT